VKSNENYDLLIGKNSFMTFFSPLLPAIPRYNRGFCYCCLGAVDDVFVRGWSPVCKTYQQMIVMALIA
jgi:hypothetical protein